jgi:hypothetical protein
MYSLPEVFTHLGLALSPWNNQALEAGLGMVAETVFELGPGSNHSNQTLYRAFQALPYHYFFAEKEVICSYTDLIPMAQNQQLTQRDVTLLLCCRLSSKLQWDYTCTFTGKPW